MLLLRSSGDVRADEIRLGFLRNADEQLAQAAGWHAGGADGDRLLLRAQVVLATALGLAVLRSSTQLGPLATTTEDDLVQPLRDLVGALLRPR